MGVHLFERMDTEDREAEVEWAVDRTFSVEAEAEVLGSPAASGGEVREYLQAIVDTVGEERVDTEGPIKCGPYAEEGDEQPVGTMPKGPGVFGLGS